MCGIVGGFWQHREIIKEEDIKTALVSLGHRGPDDSGYSLYRGKPITGFLGHTRLSIIDLSKNGHQPFCAEDGRYHLVFNGEIYNYIELREELKQKGCVFSTKTDTEVLLAAWIVWGEQALKKIVGMFAFVVYDKLAQTLTCIRDAFGIKPLFYQSVNNSFIFASEIKALTPLSKEQKKPNWTRIYQYLMYCRYDNREDTFYDNVYQLLPASGLIYSLREQKIIKKFTWWEPSIAENRSISYDAAIEQIRETFLDNVKLHMRSDVPLGAALSGGIDSSAVVGAMRYHAPDRPIHTFSFIAKNHAISEEKWIDCVNKETGAKPHKIVLSGEALANDIDSLVETQGEPFTSTSIYAQYAVFKYAREAGMKVILDGQGADEVLAGYRGYPGYRLMSLIETGKILKSLKFASKWSKWPNRQYYQAWVHFLSVLMPMKLYTELFSFYNDARKVSWLNDKFVKEQNLSKSVNVDRVLYSNRGRRVIRELASSIQHFGLPALLRHADRNAMHFSIENRVPFLTTEFVELAYSLPERYLLSEQGETKHIFRQAMKGIVPDEILKRKDKIGFESPEKAWLFQISDQIREWLKASSEIPMLEGQNVLKMYDKVVSGQTRYTAQIWRLINFVRWYQINF